MEEKLVAPPGAISTIMKAISFSLWGDKEEYIAPLIRNLELVRRHFPGWTIVVYADDALNPAIVDELRRGGAQVFFAGSSPDTRGAFWRYRALALPNLEAVLFRDSDSLLTARDAAFVARWEASDYPLLVCRDHPNQTAPVPAGIWGVKGRLLPELRSLVDGQQKTHAYGDDEKFLVRSVYLPWRGEMMIFSPFFRYRGERTEPEPVARLSSADYLGRRDMSEWTVWDDAAMEDALASPARQRLLFFVPQTPMARVASFVWEKRLDWRYVRYFLFGIRIWKRKRVFRKLADGSPGPR